MCKWINYEDLVCNLCIIDAVLRIEIDQLNSIDSASSYPICTPPIHDEDGAVYLQHIDVDFPKSKIWARLSFVPTLCCIDEHIDFDR